MSQSPWQQRHVPLVVITRAAEDCGPMRDAVGRMGAEALCIPCISQRVLPAAPGDDEVLAALPAYAAIAFASRHAVHALVQRLHVSRRRLPPFVPLFAVGPGTAQVAAASWGRTAAQTTPSDAEHLLQLLLRSLPVPGAKVLLPAAREGRRVLESGLRQGGHAPHFWPLYETMLPAPLAERRRIWPRLPSYILFGSPSAVEGFLRLAHWPPGSRALSIGPATSQALAARSIAVYRQSPRHDAGGLLACLKHCLEEDDERQ